MNIKLLICFFIQISSIYSFDVQTINKGTIHLSDYTNKKILLVNIATGCEYVNQLQSLEQLYQTYKDSLVVIAFPSNSFGNENHSDSELNRIMTDSLGIHFPIASISDVFGANAHPIYQWLSDTAENGSMNVIVHGDFRKILISNTGKIVGLFRDEVAPLDSVMINAVTHSFQP